MSEMQQSPSATSGRKCTLCDEDGAMFKCSVCEELLCEDCQTAHRRQKATKMHAIISMSAKEKNEVHLNGECSDPKYCSIVGHENQSIAGYCYLCNILVCQVCISENHENHNYASLDDAFENQKKNVESRVNKLQQNSPANSIQKCDKAIRDCKEHSQLLTNSVQEHFKQYSIALKQHLTKEMENISSSTKHKLQQLQEVKSRFADKVNGYEAFMQTVHELEILLQSQNSKTAFIMKSNEALKNWEQLEFQLSRDHGDIDERNLRCVACSTDDFSAILKMIASVEECNIDDGGDAHTSLVCVERTPFLEAVRSLTMTVAGNGSSLPYKSNAISEESHSITARKLCEGDSMSTMNLKDSTESPVNSNPGMTDSQHLNDLNRKELLLELKAVERGICTSKATREAAVSSVVLGLARLRLKSRGLVAHWKLDGDCIVVHSDTPRNAKKSLEIIIGSIEQENIPVRNECLRVMMSDKWCCRKSDIEIQYHKQAWVSYSKATNEIVVCSTCSAILRDVCSDIRKFLQDHVLKSINLHYSGSFASLMKQHTRTIQRLETELSQSAVSLTFTDQTINIQGFGFATALALRKLKSLALKIGMKLFEGEDRFDSSDEELDSDEDDTRFEDTDSLQKKTVMLPTCSLVVAEGNIDVGAVCCPGGDVTIYVVKGDITQLPVSSVVNPADPKLKHNGGLARILVQKGGPWIQTECTAFVNTLPNKELSPGKSFCSTAGSLPFSAIMHAVTCRWDKHPDSARQLLFDAVTSALQIADDKMLSSIAVPAIGAGAYKYPVDISTETIVDAIKEFLTTNPHTGLKEVYLCDMAGESTVEFVRALEKHFKAFEIILSNPEYGRSEPIQHEHDGSLSNNNGQRDLHENLKYTSAYAASKIFLL